MVKKVKRFLRREWNKYSKLGRRRGKKQKWKRPTGRHNKMREKVGGYPAVVSIGYSTPKSERGKIMGKIPLKVHNVSELEMAGAENIVIIGNVGKRKKIEMAKIAMSKGIEIFNMNPKSFLKKSEGKVSKK